MVILNSTVVTQVANDELLFGQLAEFCRLVQEEFLPRFNEMTDIPTSSVSALAFAETLMLCPTEEAVRACIRRELPFALSFVIAIQGLQRRLQEGTYCLPPDAPEFQTPFFVLSNAVRDFLESARAQPV